jgi:hypothetical protein
MPVALMNASDAGVATDTGIGLLLSFDPHAVEPIIAMKKRTESQDAV